MRSRSQSEHSYLLWTTEGWGGMETLEHWTYHLQPQLSGQGVSLLKLFPPEPTCTNCARVSGPYSPLPDEKPMQPTAAVA